MRASRRPRSWLWWSRKGGRLKFVAERPAPADWRERAFTADDLPRLTLEEDRN